MTLGSPSVGEAAKSFDIAHWAGEVPPRDEFFWMSQINKATLVVNADEGLLDRRKASQWASGQRSVIRDASHSGAMRPRMYIRYEPLMVKACGLEVTAMHAGRSSQDIHSTFHRAMLRELTLDVAEALVAVRKALWQLAWDHRDVIGPCYTNGVAAQPNSYAHTWLGHLAGFERDFEKLCESWKRVNRSPMGTTVLNGTSWPLNRDRMAELLGFDGLIENAYDAGQIAATDVAVDAAVGLISPLLHVGQFLQDIMVQYAQPRPWILVTSVYASSAMPQKRNPGALIDVRRDANAVLGALQSVLWRAHDLTPGMYDAKDIVLNGEILRDAATVLQRFAETVALLKVDGARALDELNRDWTASQELADILMSRHGIPFRLGHRAASRMVTKAREAGLTPLTFPYDEIVRIYEETAAECVSASGAETDESSIPPRFPLSEAEFREALDPCRIVANRRTKGGPQTSELARMLDEAKARNTAAEAWVRGRRVALETAESRLEAAFDALEREGEAVSVSV